MPSITVIRHSLAQANEQGVLMGAKLNSPLSEKGIELAKSKGMAFKNEGFAPDRVYTSQLLRAKQTADTILDTLGLTPPLVELADLNERDFGIHDGQPYKSVLDAFEKYGDNPPTIETVSAFVARVSQAWEQIKNETDGVTLVVTHSNPEMVLQCLAFYPDRVERFWELGDPAYCEGFIYEFKS